MHAHHCEPVANIRQGNDDYKSQLKKSSTSSIKHVQAVQTSSITNTKQKTEQIAKTESKSPKPKPADALTSLPIEKGKNESERKFFLLDDDHHCEPVANIRQGNDYYKSQLKKSSTSSIKHVQAVQTSSITNTKQKTEQIAKIESKSPKPKTSDALTSLAREAFSSVKCSEFASASISYGQLIGVMSKREKENKGSTSSLPFKQKDVKFAHLYCLFRSSPVEDVIKYKDERMKECKSVLLDYCTAFICIKNFMFDAASYAIKDIEAELFISIRLPNWPGETLNIDILRFNKISCNESRESKLTALQQVKERCLKPPPPLFICAYPNCSLARREVYQGDPLTSQFESVYSLECSEKCLLGYHGVCWKKVEKGEEKLVGSPR
ncbi:uncharacterized protein LOC134839972 [Symsagittifera roscoffensis]|uniref:uncharacterized protein LOC134839972 n=1 Tax=Symsagittifera roscoffensis TaxID=84072 RepID=UPI00307B2CA0